MADDIIPVDAPQTTTANTVVATSEAQPEAQPSGNLETLLGKKPEAVETPEQKTARETAEKSNVVPEKYEIKVPEGMNIDVKSMETLTPIFKELGLNQEKVQKLVDAYAPMIKQQSEVAHSQAMKDYEGVIEGWKKETIKDLGADYANKLAPAAVLLDKFPQGKELREFLDAEQSGIGNHPLMVKFMIWLGEKIKPDSFPDNNKVTTTDKFDDKIKFKVTA